MGSEEDGMLIEGRDSNITLLKNQISSPERLLNAASESVSVGNGNAPTAAQLRQTAEFMDMSFKF